MEGLRVEDDHDGNTLNEKVVIGDFDTKYNWRKRN